jgi:glutamate dehydrogenase
MLPFVRDYFPKAVVEHFGDVLTKHFLFNEIAGTVITNRIVDAGGVTLVPLVAGATEREPTEVAAAYLAAEEIFGARAVRATLHRDVGTASETLYGAMVRLEDALLAATRALLWTSSGRATLGSMRARKDVFEGAAVLRQVLPDLLPDRVRRQERDEHQALVNGGLESELAHEVTRSTWVAHAVFIAELAARAQVDFRAAATAFFAGGFGTGVLDLAAAVERQGWPDRWDFIALGPIQRGLFAAAVDLGALVVARGVEVLSEPRIAAVTAQIDEALRERVPVSALIVLSERLKQRVSSV